MFPLISLVFVVLGMIAVPPAVARTGRVEALLEQQRQHGFTSPGIAAQALAEVGADVVGQPVALRMQYHNQLASLYISAEDSVKSATQLDALERMKVDEQCVPCGHYKLLRQTQQALRAQDLAAAQVMLPTIEAIVSQDPHLMQAVYYVRAGLYDANGNHARAIEDGQLASQLAIKLDNPAEQVRTLNLLMLANLGRRDVARAESLSKEAYALAERIGFVYMMAYIRGNSSWIYSIKGERDKQLAALTDVLTITRAHPGLGDSELVALVNLAVYHGEQKSFKQAAEMAAQAVALANKQNKPVARGVALGSLGEAQIELGDLDNGVETLLQGVQTLKKAGATPYLIEATSALAGGYERAGRYKEALAALQSVVKLMNDAKLREREKAIADAQEKFSGERKDNEIVRLSLESRGRKAEVDARLWQQRLWATAALALALGGALLLQMIKRTRARNRLLEDSNAVLSDQSVHDPLTGAFNRRHCVTLMAQHAAHLAGKPRERSAGVGLLLLDVDHFKQVNDTYGHAAGDAVLVEIARRLESLVRQHDVVVRWGGEEFVLILPGTSSEGMTVLAQRVLTVIGVTPIELDGKQVPVTVSAGCVCFPLLAGHAWEDALKVADVAMYMAKQGGRNRAICVMQVAEGTAHTRLVDDLGMAAAAGQVVLSTVSGPDPMGRDANLVSI